MATPDRPFDPSVPWDTAPGSTPLGNLREFARIAREHSAPIGGRVGIFRVAKGQRAALEAEARARGFGDCVDDYLSDHFGIMIQVILEDDEPQTMEANDGTG